MHYFTPFSYKENENKAEIKGNEMENKIKWTFMINE